MGDCMTCGGDRYIVKAHWSGDPQREREVTCPDCATSADDLADVRHEQRRERELEAQHG